MDETPTLHRYCPADRAEVFDLFRQSFQPELAALKISQFRWKYEISPFTPSEGPNINILRLGPKLVGLSLGFHLEMWMAGIECPGEGRGGWVVHPAYRGRNLWRGTRTYHKGDPPVRFGWSHMPHQVTRRAGYFSDAVRPLVRVLNVGALLEKFTHSRILGSIGSVVSDILRRASAPRAGRQSSAVVRLEAFDDRVDRLWEHARRRDRAMVVREQRYLNWRYCQRPDATYILYGYEHGPDLEGFLVARDTSYLGMRWGYLVDFLAPERSSGVLTSLIRNALADFRENGAAAASCIATDPLARRSFFRSGFFPAPQRRPIRFTHFLDPRRTDLAKFKELRRWYLTMGDGDLEL